jgi:hypothetical protein
VAHWKGTNAWWGTLVARTPTTSLEVATGFRPASTDPRKTAPMADARKAIHAYLTPEAHDRWHDFAAEQGVSVSGLLEAIARDWKEQLDTGADVPAEVEQLAKTARRIDAARRRRQRV